VCLSFDRDLRFSKVLMMVPVVFLVLPVTVLFAFYPGVLGLHLTTP